MSRSPTGTNSLPSVEPRGHGLVLRRWRSGSAEEAAAVLRGLADPEFRAWNTPYRQVDDLDAAYEWLQGREDAWEASVVASFGVIEATTEAILGCVGLSHIDRWMGSARVGYWVLPDARGRGVATMSLILAARWGFREVGLHRIALDHAIGHAASCRVAEHGGFAYEGTMREAMFAAGRYDAFRDAHLHARLSTDPEPEYDDSLADTTTDGHRA